MFRPDLLASRKGTHEGAFHVLPGNLAPAPFLAVAGACRSARPLPRLGVRHRLVAAAPDRHDDDPVRRFLHDLSPDDRRLRPVSHGRPDLLDLHNDHVDPGMPVLLHRRMLHPSAPRPDGHLSAADHVGRGFPFPDGLSARYRPVAGVPRRRLHQRPGAAEPDPHLRAADGVRLGLVGPVRPGHGALPRFQAPERGRLPGPVLPDADHVRAGAGAKDHATPHRELDLFPQSVRTAPGPDPLSGRRWDAAVADELPGRLADRAGGGRRRGAGDGAEERQIIFNL